MQLEQRYERISKKANYWTRKEALASPVALMRRGQSA